MDRFYSDGANERNEYRAAGYTIELRDTGAYGFQLPPDQVIQPTMIKPTSFPQKVTVYLLQFKLLLQIIPQGEEMVPAVLEFAEELTRNPLNK